MLWIEGPERKQKVLSNMMVDLASYVSFDPEEVGVTELVYYPALEAILSEVGTSDEEAVKGSDSPQHPRADSKAYH